MMKCSHCNGECCYLDSREGTTRYAQLLTHGKGVHFCKHCEDGTVRASEENRFKVEPEYEIAPGCRCCSCWEYTGKWLVSDIKDEMEDLVFDTEEQAKEWVKQNG